MIRLRPVLHVLGIFLLILSITMTIPLVYGWITGQEGVRALGLSVIPVLILGLALWRGSRRPQGEFTVREGILLTTATWMAISLFGSLPYLLSPQFHSVVDAVFESTSGFTTTGATVLSDVEVLPKPIQLWRHLTHWLGGMGVVLLGIAVLPLIGAGGMALYRAEFSGARSERLAPRVAQTAFALWRIYVALTLAEYVLLRWAGMDSFDALCFSLSTLATGGFAPRTASVGAYPEPIIQYIIIVFMVLAGVNFAQQYRIWVQGQVRRFFTDIEVRTYLGILIGATLIVFLDLTIRGDVPLEPTFRGALFQVVSIGTTAGLTTVDYEAWGSLPHAVLLGLMFIGGCTGSTSGGWKVFRVLLMTRLVHRELKRTSERRGVFAVRVGGQVVPEHTIQSLLNLVYLSLLLFLAGMLAVSATGVDLLTTISSVASTLFGIGPGFGHVGPAENYGHLPETAKWVLCFSMLAGRLEFYTAVVVFTASFWRK
jgi:trk system potassium uptake protein